LNNPQSREAIAFEKANQRSLRLYKKPITHPSELLKKTNYFSSNPGEVKMEEPQALSELVKFIKKFPDAVLVAHNATFDMKAIQARLRYNRLPNMGKYHVVDTMKISRFFFIPVLLSMENNSEAKEFLEQLIAKTKFRSYSSSLGNLAKVFKIKLDGWHQASEDVKMMFQIFQKLIEYLKTNKDVDIRKQQGIQAKRLRKMK
jgi:DNA polymerase III alpha subunit (gram-positive type)